MSKKTNIFAKNNKIKRNINIPDQDNMIKERVNLANKDLGIKGNIISLDPKDIDTWILRDRADFELGDIEALATSIKTKGQAQPIVLVKKSDIFKPKLNNECRYIVIAGYRRWRACVENNIKIDCVIKELSFDQAVECLEAENEKESVSEYSKGIFYSKLKDEYGYTLDKLSKQLGIALSKVNRYISFSKVPSVLWDEVKDMSCVSSRTSSEILEILNSNPNSLQFFILIADKIKKGYGHTRIRKLYEKWNDSVGQLNEKISPIQTTKSNMRINFNALNISEEERINLIEKINNIIAEYK